MNPGGKKRDNPGFAAPAEGTGGCLSWLTASRIWESQALPCSETCCLDGLMEQSSFGMRWEGEGGDGGLLHSPAPHHPHTTKTTEIYWTPSSPLGGPSRGC